MTGLPSVYPPLLHNYAGEECLGGTAPPARAARLPRTRPVEVSYPQMTAPLTPFFQLSKPPLVYTALRSLNVTILVAPLPMQVGATWHSRTKTLTLATEATDTEHLEVMADLWRIANGLPARPIPHQRRRHLHAVP